MSDTTPAPDPTEGADETPEETPAESPVEPEAESGPETGQGPDSDLPVEQGTIQATGIDPDDPAYAETAQADPAPESPSDPTTHAYVAPTEDQEQHGYTP